MWIGFCGAWQCFSYVGWCFVVFLRRRNLAAFSMSYCGLICNFAAVIDDDGKQGL